MCVFGGRVAHIFKVGMVRYKSVLIFIKVNFIDSFWNLNDV